MNDYILDLIANLKIDKIIDREYLGIINDLSITEYRGIMAFEDEQEMTCREMAKVMELSPSRSSRVINNLVQKGYFIRRTSSRDRRSVVVTLSKKGIEAKEKIKENQEKLEKSLQQKITDNELNMIKNSLKILIDYFEV
ncbi:MAG: MarR family transcriptional regulator [Atribacterota bacterium]|jgi:DNA-binding MarR family transcriptional regulator|nr:MarR family transcriptional regulator [Atribacterota bacterium]